MTNEAFQALLARGPVLLDGATHHATEDIAVMRALPNMTVLVPSDATSAQMRTTRNSSAQRARARHRSAGRL